jgi:phenylacetate-coenzyme A ligase PaaK-like adenylate-forming protein
MRHGFLTPFFVIRKRRALERSCRWTRERLTAQQELRLARLRRLVMARSPFYQRFHRGLEQAPLQELPVLTKPAMMENFDDLVTDRTVRLADAEAFLRSERADGLFRGRYVTLSTSGSTGRRGVLDRGAH